MKFGKIKASKLLTAIITPIVGLSATGLVVATVLSQSKPVDPSIKKDYTVTFLPGEGKFAKGQSNKTEVWAGECLDQIVQPQATATGKLFAGWVDEHNKPVYAKQAIRSNTELKATYVSPTGEYLTLTFLSDDKNVLLHGNVSIAVNKGYYFFMVNRPCAIKPNCYFTGWKYASGPKTGFMVEENDVLTESVKLVPVFSNAVTVTWNGMGATRTSGAESTTVKNGTLFGNINQPSFRYDGHYFAGWYKDPNYETAWSSDEPVEANATAYAKWSDSPIEGYTTFHYMKYPGAETDPTPVFSPASSQIVKKGDSWESVFKPQVSTTSGNYVIDHWEYSLDGSTDWTRMTSATTFNVDDVYIAPILTPAITDVLVSGSSTVITQKSTTYKAYVVGANDTPVTWHVYDQKPTAEVPSPSASAYASINTDGVLTTRFVNNAYKKVYVQAISTLDTNKKSDPLEVSILMPYVGSNDVWFNDDSNWYSITMDQLCDTELTSYSAINFNDGSTISINKQLDESSNDLFTSNLYIGRNNTILPANFLSGFERFNGKLDFSAIDEGYIKHGANNIRVINDGFMEECVSFNKEINLVDVEYIGDDFLYGAKSFNNGNEPIYVSNPKIKKLGKNFLGNCYSFNQQVLFEDGKHGFVSFIQEIGDFFLFNCYSFNQELTIPSTVTRVDPYFMLNCNTFTGNLIVNCSMDAFVGNDQQFCATSPTYVDPITKTTKTSTIASKGFVVYGNVKEAFINKFATVASESRNVYRKSKKSEADSHAISTTTDTASTTVAASESVVTWTQAFSLTLNNARSEAITDASLVITVKNKNVVLPITSLPTGDTVVNYTASAINQMLIDAGYQPMTETDPISFNLVRVGSYEVTGNRLYEIQVDASRKLLSDSALEQLPDGMFLVKNQYNEYTVSDIGFTQFFAESLSAATYDVTLVKGKFYTGPDKVSDIKTFNIHGILDSNSNKLATVEAYNKVAMFYLDNRYSNLYFDNVILEGRTTNYTSHAANGVRVADMKCNNCDFIGAHTCWLNGAEFTNCKFDNSDLFYQSGSTYKTQYSLFLYGDATATLTNCKFISCGKALKIYSDGDTKKDLPSYIRNCSFIIDMSKVPVAPEVKCPIEVDGSLLGASKYMLYHKQNTMTGYDEYSITELFALKDTTSEHIHIEVYEEN